MRSYTLSTVFPEGATRDIGAVLARHRLARATEGCADVAIVDGTGAPSADLEAAVGRASEGPAPVLAIFTLGRTEPFRVRRETLIARGAVDAMDAGAPDSDLVTRVRALLLRSLPPRVLLVEDTEKILDWMETECRAAGMETLTAKTLAEARAAFATGPVDAVVTDRMLPDGDGLEFVEQLRAAGISLPVLVHTALSDISERIHGLERSGADDYLCKPAHADELRARLRVLLRPRVTDSVLGFGPLEIARALRVVRWRGKRVDLRPRELDLLIYLAERAGLAIPQSMLYADVWEKTYMEPGSNPVAAVKSRLVAGFRAAIPDERLPEFIRADASGYIFEPTALLALDGP